MINCPNCGEPTKENENYCGYCGTHLQEDNDQYVVYNYNTRIAKENKAYMTFGHIIPLSIILSIPLIVGAIIVGAFIDDTQQILGLPAGFACTMLCTFTMLGAIILITVKLSKYMNASLQSIVFDKTKNLYYIVRFNRESYGGWDTTSRAAAAAASIADAEEKSKEAQKDDRCIQAVADYQAGLNQPTKMQKWFTGYPITVIELKNPSVVRKKKKFTEIRYARKNGSDKKIKIPNVYPKCEIIGREEMMR